jgi:hypothetical protein
MLTGAALALAIAAVWTLLAIMVGIGIGRAAARGDYGRRFEREVERELRRRSGIAGLHVVSGARSAHANQAVVDEHRDELRASRHL